MNWKMCLTGLMTGLVCLGTTHAAVISIDFNVTGSETYSGSSATAGGLTPLAGQTGNWNAMDLGTSLGGLSVPVTLTDALDGDGVVTDVDFTLNTNSQVIQIFGQPPQSDTLGVDIAFVQSNAIVGFAFADLDPGTEYQIRFFGQTVNGSNAPVNFAIISIAGGTPATGQGSALQNHVDFTATSDALGNITGSFERPFSGGTGSLSGVQIVAVPEPASLGLLTLGLALVASGRWRQYVN